MAKKSPNVVNLATKRKAGKSTAVKTKAPEPVEKVEKVEAVVEQKEPTVDELAEQRVKDLLKDVDFKPKKEEDDLLELDEDDGQPKSMEWLEEQVGALGTENERLRSEAGEAKENYSKLYTRYEQLRNGGEATGEAPIPQDTLVPDSLVKRGALSLFDEFQTEYLRHRVEVRSQTKITLVALIQKMLNEFPFLSEYRKF